MAADTDPTGIGEPVHGEDLEAVPWHRQTRAFAVRTLRELFRNRAALFWGLAAPVFFYVVFGLLLSSSDNTGFYRAGNAVSFGVFGAFSVSMVIFAQTLSADVKSRRYRKLRSLPVAASADVLGRFLGGFALATASFALVLVVGVATGAELAVRSPLSLLVVAASLFLFCLVAMAAAVVVASILDEGEYIVGITNMLVLGLFFLTGYNGLVPTIAPEPVLGLANYLPNALATRLGIYHLTTAPGEWGTLTPPAMPTEPLWVALLAVYAVVIAAVGSWVMDRRIYQGEAGE